MPNPSSQQHDSTIRSILTKASYRNQELTKRDVMGALSQYKSLKPQCQKFTFNDGRQRDLLVLDGTIPVSYRGATYNIPVQVWPLDTHPNHSPLCYVKPTPDMQIKVSKSVDSNGRVYLPYLHEWSSSGSDILTLLQMMIIAFSEEPPVFARQRGSQQPPPLQPPQQPMPQQTPYPIGQSYGSSPTFGRPNSQLIDNWRRMTNVNTASMALNNLAKPEDTEYAYSGCETSSSNRPPYPPAGPAGAGMPPYPVHPQNYPTPGYPPGGGGGSAQQPTPYPPMGVQSPYGGYPPPYAAASSHQANSGPSGATDGTGTITAEMLKMSLQTAVEEKVRKVLLEDVHTKQAEIQNLVKIQEEMSAGSRQLQQALNGLDTECRSLDGLVTSMRQEVSSLENALEKLEALEAASSQQNGEDGLESKIDEKIVTVTPLFKQIVSCYSEDLAIQDAIYYLSEGQRKGVLDCDAFLKKVRELSRKQFVVRATMQKAREKAGLSI